MARPYDDLTGKRFGKLVVVNKIDNYTTKTGKKPKGGFWNCICDCGNYRIAPSVDLKSGQAVSCNKGDCNCHRTFNTYDISGSYGIGYDNKGNSFIFDLEDYEKIKIHKWYKTNSSGYWITDARKDTMNILRGNKKQLHRFVMDAYDRNQIVDHINHNLNDVRKINLRIVTQHQNTFNNKKPINNTSGYVGVHWSEKLKKWIAYIKVNYHRYHLGVFINVEDAIAARKEAEQKYFGEYSYDASMALAEQNTL